MGYRVQYRRDTAERWAEINPILLDGEIGYVKDNPNQYKMGDGVHRWNDLPLRGFDGTIAPTLGYDDNAVLSQRIVTEKFEEQNEKITKLGSEVDELQSVLGVNLTALSSVEIERIQGYITPNGDVASGTVGFYSSPVDVKRGDMIVVKLRANKAFSVISKYDKGIYTPLLIGDGEDVDKYSINAILSDEDMKIVVSGYGSSEVELKIGLTRGGIVDTLNKKIDGIQNADEVISESLNGLSSEIGLLDSQINDSESIELPSYATSISFSEENPVILEESGFRLYSLSVTKGSSYRFTATNEVFNGFRIGFCATEPTLGTEVNVLFNGYVDKLDEVVSMPDDGYLVFSKYKMNFADLALYVVKDKISENSKDIVGLQKEVTENKKGIDEIMGMLEKNYYPIDLPSYETSVSFSQESPIIQEKSGDRLYSLAVTKGSSYRFTATNEVLNPFRIGFCLIQPTLGTGVEVLFDGNIDKLDEVVSIPNDGYLVFSKYKTNFADLAMYIGKDRINVLADEIEEVSYLVNKEEAVSIFKNVVMNITAIGDSLTAGAQSNEKPLTEHTYPSVMGKAANAKVSVCAIGGKTTKYMYNIGSELIDYENTDLYIIWLGTNAGFTMDAYNAIQTTVGWENYPSTEVGTYCKWIDRIKALNPDSIIVLINIFAGGGVSEKGGDEGATLESTQSVIRKVAEDRNLLCIETTDYTRQKEPTWHPTGNLHFNVYGNIKIANIFMNKIGSYLESNLDKFENFFKSKGTGYSGVNWVVNSSDSDI